MDLDPLFNPKGVVVAGASTHPGKFGFVALHNIVANGYQGRIIPVNRDGAEILGIKSLTSMDEVPAGEADLVVVCTPASTVPDILRTSAERGIRAAFIVSGGFRELGAEGRAAEDEVVALAAELGMAVAGPNGQGLVSTPASLCAQIVAPCPPAGPIAIASQSGNLVSTAMNLARQAGVGVSRAVSAGNAAMVEVADYIEYYATDPETKAVVAYVEGLEDGRRFYEAVRAATRKKPVFVVKGGASALGAEAAASHTGSLATDDRVFDGVLRQAGAIRVDSMDAAFEAAATAATQPLPKGPNTIVMTTAGGWGVLTSDAIASSSLELMALPNDLPAKIDELLPPRWSRGNPVDLAGGETRDTIPLMLDLLAGHPDVDSVVYLGSGIQGNVARSYTESPFHPDHGLERMAGFHLKQEERYMEAAAEASDKFEKPIIVASELATADPSNPAPATLKRLGRIMYPTPQRAIQALDAAYRAGQQLEQ